MKFFKLSGLKLMFVLLGFSAIAQKTNYAVHSIPEELKINANEVVRLDYTKLVVESKKQATLYTKYAVTLLNSKSGKDEQQIPYNKNTKIGSLNARIYDANGKLVKKFNKSDFSDHSAIDGSTMFDDSRFKYAEFNYGLYPYTVEIEYEKIYNGVLYFPDCFVQGFNASVEQFVLIAETPKDLECHYKARNIDIEPEITQSGNKTIYQWSVSNRPSLIGEELMPSYQEILPYIEIAPQIFQYGIYHGNASTWQSMGLFFKTLAKGRDVLSPEMASKVKELTSGLNSNDEKIEVLYRYLQDNTRYVSVQLGIGGWQPFEAKYVEKNKYGDCKALSNFMFSMLKEAGITAQPGIIYRDRDRRLKIDEDFPALFGNHMLLYIPSEDIWLECTSNHYPMGYIGASNDNRPVLLITEDGGKLTTSPGFTTEENIQSSQTVINIDVEGSANIESTVKTKGPKHEIYRSIENYLTSKDFEKYFLENTGLPAFNIEKLEVKSEGDRPEAQLDYQLL